MQALSYEEAKVLSITLSTYYLFYLHAQEGVIPIINEKILGVCPWLESAYTLVGIESYFIQVSLAEDIEIIQKIEYFGKESMAGE